MVPFPLMARRPGPGGPAPAKSRTTAGPVRVATLPEVLVDPETLYVADLPLLTLVIVATNGPVTIVVSNLSGNRFCWPLRPSILTLSGQSSDGVPGLATKSMISVGFGTLGAATACPANSS